MRTSAFSVLSYLASTASATPDLSFAFNSQLPPVAKWGSSYSYELAPDTFRSSEGSITYSSPDLPSWLSINGRTLSGTPSGGSGESTITFELVASDSTGNSSNDCTLLITDSDLPTYSESDLEEVLKDSGPVANPDSAVLVPDQKFEIKFPSSFFTSEGNVIGHYAVTGDHSPLPNWLQFDGGSGTFSGTAPSVNSQIAQAQQFSVIYIVSTYEGFASTGAEFNLLLGANIFSMNVSTDHVNATAERDFSYSVPLNEITLNGEPVTSANLSSAKADIPEEAQSWLKWDDDAFELSGTPPDSAAGSQYTVEIDIADKFNDAVSWDVAISVTSENNQTVFTDSSLSPANATRGKWFEYDMSDYIINKDIELSLSSNVKWLSVNNDNFTLSGMVPRNFDKANVNITASTKSSNNKNKRSGGASTSRLTSQEAHSDSLSASLELYGVGPMMSSSSVSSLMSRTTSHSHSRSSSYRTISSTNSRSSSATSTGASGSSRTGTATGTSASTASGLNMPNGSKKNSNNHAVAIGCGVGIPLGVIALAALIILLFCCRRRRKAARGAPGGEDGPEDKAVGADDSNISAPRPSSMGMAMAPVFRNNSHSSDEFMDAVEYPGELPGGDEKTVYSAADKEKDLGTPDSMKEPRQGWDSPKHASTMNFIHMDDGDEHSDQDTIASLNGLNPPGPQGTMAHDVPPQDEDGDVLGEVPRESWRHTNMGERRWQDARLSQSSLASIVPTEPPTVLMAQGEFAENMAQSQELHQRLLAEQEQQRGGTQTNTVPPLVPQPAASQNPNRQSDMQREYSSGVLHRVGSHSSSVYSNSVRNTLSDDIGDHYRTESSTESSHSHELSDDSGAANFRAYRDENGELHWREETDNAAGTKLNNVGLDRKPSAAKTPKGDQGEFVFV